MRSPVISVLLAVVLFPASRYICAADLKRTPTVEEKAVAISAPRPDYPYEARRAGITGAGVAVLGVDVETGKVTSALMAQSTGSVILDAAALGAFRQWRFKPRTVSKVKIPIRFTRGGEVVTEYHVKEKPMDDALAAFLGKGTVAKGPIPAYPRSVPWTTKQGTGRYEIHVGKDGRVSEVRVLKASGDAMFDRTTVDTLRKWRLRRGPLILVLPLAFKLTPTHYEVDIPKNG
ncbi:MAG TPA: TonB family protein [Pyrinomonadaceae bacterium]